MLPSSGTGEACVIVYNLRCKNSHEFEGWFKDSESFDQQASGKKLVCPMCNSHAVEKAPTAPAVSGTKKSAQSADEVRKVRQFMSGWRKYVTDNAEYVGPRFPEEARKIHYEEVPSRPIRGQASKDEADELREEGIEFTPLPPFLTRDHH